MDNSETRTSGPAATEEGREPAPGAGPETAADNGKQGTWAQALGSFALSVLVILTVRWALFEPYVIPSGSMIPTLLIHDHILVNKFSYGIRAPFTSTWLMRFGLPDRGDVVVFRAVDNPGLFLVKRVVGLPGDRIEFNERSQLLINGQPVSSTELTDAQVESYLQHWPADAKESYREEFQFRTEDFDGQAHVAIRSRSRLGHGEGPFEVPPGHVFMIGDNRDNSSDSRAWGALPVDNILGKAVLVWLSCEETLPEMSQLCDPSTIRWPRIFQSIR